MEVDAIVVGDKFCDLEPLILTSSSLRTFAESGILACSSLEESPDNADPKMTIEVSPLAEDCGWAIRATSAVGGPGRVFSSIGLVNRSYRYCR